MGYKHYWTYRRAFTDREWKRIIAESKRIVAKAEHGLYSGKENLASESGIILNGRGFKEEGAWRTFPVPAALNPCQDRPILLAGPRGTLRPFFDKYVIGLNGRRPEDCESFVFFKGPMVQKTIDPQVNRPTGSCETEYRPYDAVVVSILAVARTVASEAVSVRSDGGESAIRYLF